MNDTTVTLTLNDREEAVQLFGNRDQFLRLIRDALSVRIIARGDTIQIDGPQAQVEQAERVFQQLRLMLQRQPLTPESVRTVLAAAQKNEDPGPVPPPVAALANNRSVRPRTDGQARYVQAMKDNDVILAIGPAGTGKTYLAVGMAVNMLRQGAVKRIVLVRPAVEAGEKLGFLPGDIVAKINPYLRPLFDGLNDLMERDQISQVTWPATSSKSRLFAFMCGRMLNQSAIILDEGQNMTILQMKMFSLACGQRFQDYRHRRHNSDRSPQRHAKRRLTDAVHRPRQPRCRIAIVYLNEHDIVRHPLVQRIVKAYE